MATLSLGEGKHQFALAILSYNTFMHLGPESKLKTLKQIRRHLRPAGVLFIDLINPFRVAQTPDDPVLTLEKRLVDPESGQLILQMASSRIEETSQLLQITWIYDVIPAAGGAVHRTVAEGIYYYLYPHQLELLLNEAGFRQESLAGDYENVPFGEDSERLLVLARPASGGRDTNL